MSPDELINDNAQDVDTPDIVERNEKDDGLIDELKDDIESIVSSDDNNPDNGDSEHDVFISYSTKNSDIANKICYLLENNGLQCWIAPRNIASGKNYVDEIARGIKSTKIIVLIFSKYSQESKYVNNEVMMGFTYNKPIISFNIDQSEPNDIMGYYLKVAQWLPAYPNPEGQFEKLATDALKLCNEKPRTIITSLDGFIPEDLSKQKRNWISLILLFTPIYWASFIYMGLVSKKKMWTLIGFIYAIPTIVCLILYFQILVRLFLVYPIFNLFVVLFFIFWILAIIHGLVIRNEFLTRYSVLGLMSLDKDLFDYLYEMYYKV